MSKIKVFRKKWMPMPPRRGDHFRVGPWVGKAVLVIPGFVVMLQTRYWQ